MHRARGAVVVGVLLALAASAPGPGAALHTLLAPTPAGQQLTAPLVAVAALLAWGLGGWLALTVVLTAGSRTGGAVGRCCRVALRRTAPAAARRAVAVALGLGVAVGAAGPALAAGPPAAPPASVALVTGSLDRATAGPLDWPTSTTTAGAAAPPAGRAPTVTVRPGDSLWRLAQEQLPAGAPAAAVAAQWPRWWSANRALLGDDPDLLHPGQRLVVPPDDAP